MSVEKAYVADGTQARILAQKRKAVQDEENALEKEKAVAVRERAKAIESANEKTEKTLVEISKDAEKQVESVRKLNSERVRTLNETSKTSYEKLAADTAEKIKAMDQNAIRMLEQHHASNMERLRHVTEKSEDPFYQIKSLNPILGESEKEYTIKFSLPEHEAKNLFVSGEGDSVKISLARRFQEKVSSPENNRVTRTNSFQSINETTLIPGSFDPKGIYKEYKDGVMTVFVPKIIRGVKS